MLFNSLDFAFFLPVVFVLFWFVANTNIRRQNALVVLASYIFYGWWDWRFLSLILISTCVDYWAGHQISKSKNQRHRKFFLSVSLFVNLGLLGFFKYFNFFLENFVNAFSFFGAEINASALNIVLPVGISFYTFQTLSYTIDIYRNQFEPIKDFTAFAAFVSFFPQLVAGPIERASDLLPQFLRKRVFEYDKAVDGMRQILWGLFKKMVVADNCAVFVDLVFGNPQEYSGSALVFGAIFFAFQIYCDFSGYSDIAIGVSRLFGFDLKQNFAFPYFSRNVGEFWRRWHISLSTWFRDYLYIPLGGSRGSTFNVVRNIFIIFLVSGFWHGANWTFLAWGGLNAAFFLPLILSKSNRTYLDTVANNRILPNWKELFQMTVTFGLITMSWIFFRADNIQEAVDIFSVIASPSLISNPVAINLSDFKVFSFFIVFLTVTEWFGRKDKHALYQVKFWRKPVRWSFYIIMVFFIYIYEGEHHQFIYFQF